MGTIQTKALRKSLETSADLAKLWFEERTCPVTREVFCDRGKLGDEKTGAVYVYFAKDGSALYVGQTRRGIKERVRYQTARHNRTEWWKRWTTMRFVQLPDNMDRLVLEFLLILAYSPEFNVKPSAKSLDKLLPDNTQLRSSRVPNVSK